MKHPLQALLIAPEQEMRDAILSGQKTITIREGHRDYRPGQVMLCCHLVPWAVMANITEVQHTTLREVLPADMEADGFDSLSYMLDRMKRFYPNLTEDSAVTIVRWEDANGFLVDRANA